MVNSKTRFVAELPWIGPRLGHRNLADGGFIPISGAVNPVFGKAFLAAFVPVLRDAGGGRNMFVPADGNGSRDVVRNVTGLAHIESDSYGWFVLQAKASWWERVDGVLVALLYDTSPDLALDSFPDYPQVLADLRLHDIAAVPVGLNLLLEVALPGLERSHDLKRARASRIPKAIAEALESLLATQSAEELELGLVEISSGATPPRATKPPGSRSRRDAPRITFALASCQYPAGMLNYEIAEASYRRLASRLEPDSKKTKPQFLILIGDQIYVDATAGMFDPTDQFDRFVRPYNAFFRMHAVRNVLRRLPAYMMLDDHEIEDNWEPLAWRTKSDPNLELSRELYLRFQRAGGPPREKPIGDSKEPLWYTFEIDAFPFFIADTRTERDPRTAASIDTARIMSDAQFERILRGLSDQDDDVPKFIATPAILLPRRLRATQHNHPASALRSDAWDGYPFSFHRLLAYIAEKQIRNVVFLSGDEHLSCIAEATITPPGRRRPTSIRSVHASALHAPLPFANSVRDDFAACETFEFSLPRDGRLYAGVRLEGTYACKVSTEFAPAGDGFAVIQVLLDRGRWVVSCDFDRAERDIRGGGTTTGRATSAI